MNQLTPHQLATLAKVDSPTVANVIELFNIRSYVAGYSNHTLKAVYPELPPSVGYAVTATFRAGYRCETEELYGGMSQLITDSVTIPAPRIIVFQDLDDPTRAATYGEIMATTFLKFNFVGLITSGAGRDVEQVRRLKFPCWVSSILVSHGYCRFIESNVPVVVGGLEVRPNDLLHADANGIVNIPHSIAAAVADLCEPYIQAEQIALDYLQVSKPTVEGYKQSVERMRAAMAELRSRARGFIKGKP